MRMAGRSKKEAKYTLIFYREKDGMECYSLKEGDKWLVYRKSDNKTIKSVGYSPADLAGILLKGRRS